MVTSLDALFVSKANDKGKTLWDTEPEDNEEAIERLIEIDGEKLFEYSPTQGANLLSSNSRSLTKLKFSPLTISGPIPSPNGSHFPWYGRLCCGFT
jgi:hypothetical protein